MSNVTISPNMSMPVPNVGIDPGPDWANNINACLSIIDGHNHSLGTGNQVTPAGLDINSDLTMNSNNLINTRTIRFTPQSAALSLPADIGCIYEVGVDLYYNDGSGNQIRITQSGSVAGASGTITGLPSGTASASYSAGTFVFQSATNTPANVDGGSFIFRDDTVNSHGVTVSPVNSLSSDYSLVLPLLPAVTSILTLDASGNIAASYTVDNSTIVISSGVIEVPAGGITATQLAAGAVTNAAINSSVIGFSLGANTTQFTSSGNWTVPANVTRVMVESVGGGGGGAGSAAGPKIAGFGGAGCVRNQQWISVTPSTVIPIVIGAAGSGSAPGTSGGNGGSTSFNGIVVAEGALGGQYDSAGAQVTAGSGPFTTGGLWYNLSGGSCSSGGQSESFVGGSAGVPGGGGGYGGGGGGSGSFGTGGAGGRGDSTFTGFAATGFGAGGGGAGTDGASQQAGGNGSPGLMNIYW